MAQESPQQEVISKLKTLEEIRDLELRGVLKKKYDKTIEDMFVFEPALTNDLVHKARENKLDYKGSDFDELSMVRKGLDGACKRIKSSLDQVDDHHQRIHRNVLLSALGDIDKYVNDREDEKLRAQFSRAQIARTDTTTQKSPKALAKLARKEEKNKAGPKSSQSKPLPANIGAVSSASDRKGKGKAVASSSKTSKSDDETEERQRSRSRSSNRSRSRDVTGGEQRSQSQSSQRSRTRHVSPNVATPDPRNYAEVPSSNYPPVAPNEDRGRASGTGFQPVGTSQNLLKRKRPMHP
ncbi:MAG: hypothetical protein M1828_002471 [Chrysothrix sp. TS-e1954]|nr:MAG: hypothetical protein M1828_002471 [Chrysothrix sp. TS-e1954]